MRKRFETIAKTCFENGIQLYIDSEDSFYQDPIDELAYELMEKYNMKKEVVFNTYQMYRKGMLENLQKAGEKGREKAHTDAPPLNCL